MLAMLEEMIRGVRTSAYRIHAFIVVKTQGVGALVEIPDCQFHATS